MGEHSELQAQPQILVLGFNLFYFVYNPSFAHPLHVKVAVSRKNECICVWNDLLQYFPSFLAWI